MLIGTFLGLLGRSRCARRLVQRALDIIVGFPGLIFGICVVLVMEPDGRRCSSPSSFLACRVRPPARATLLAQQQREYVIAARTLGVRRWQIMLRHILPNAVDPIIVQGAVFVVAAIFIEAALSIVGLGLQPPEPSLGILLNVGMRYITRSPSYILGPTLILLVVALSFSLLADALNQTVNRQ